MQGTAEYELKAQARRLREALAERGVKVSHTESLNLIARSHAERNWEALQARVAREEAPQEAASAAENLACDDRKLWLARLEAVLRMQNFRESDLDELMYNLLGDYEASSVNNQGMSAQLDALLADKEQTNAAGARAALVDELEQLLRTRLPLSEPFAGQQPEPIIGVEVSACNEGPVVCLDALEWFVQATDKDISTLVEQGLANSDASDAVALWLETNSRHPGTRKRLGALRERMRLVQSQDPGAVGLTVQIDEEAVARFVLSRPGARERFSPACLRRLGVSA